ncbi:MAG: hypothetical protein KDC44_13610 [Phaeodactylibacter sp.]|nr:hypothetical protein [Phaeodactylibacter sp.]
MRQSTMLLACLLWFSVVSAQETGMEPVTSSPAETVQNGRPKAVAENIPELPSNTFLTDEEVVKSLIVTVFSLIVFGLLLFRVKIQPLSSDDFIRLIILALVICSAMYLISAGWDNQQTAPAFGILGTIAGYLLGRGSNSREAADNPPSS